MAELMLGPTKFDIILNEDKSGKCVSWTSFKELNSETTTAGI
jgi:hypothetical protein